jgi:hypothetical protein
MDDSSLWGAAGTVVASLAGAVTMQWRAYRSDSAERLAEARRVTEALTLSTRAIEASNALQSRLVDLLEDNDPRATPQSRKTREPR